MKTVAVLLIFAFAAVASARDIPFKAKDDTIYCTGEDYAADECPEYYECELLDKKVCKDCVKDKYGKEKCTPDKCYEYHCVDPMYCDPSYAAEDECVEKYGKEWECEKLTKEVCVYKDDCEFVDTKKCEKYDDKCHDGKCIEYDTYDPKKCTKYEQVCKKECIKYEQEKKCEKEVEKCWEGKCVKSDKYRG